MWYFILVPSIFQIFGSVMLDIYVNSELFKFHFLDNWFRFFLSSKEASIIYIYQPELLLVKNSIYNYYYTTFFTEFRSSIYDMLDKESFKSPLMLLPKLILIIYFTVLFITFYFSYYSSSVKEESTIDADFLAASLTVESEKELGSLDDIILCFLVIVYVFGWYFYVHC